MRCRTPIAGRPRILPWLCALATTGCFDFEDRTEVEDLRVLAVAAERPEIMVLVELNEGAEASDAPLFTVTADPAPTTVRVLVVDPRAPEASLTYRVEACPYDEALRCDPFPDDLRLPVVERGTGTPEVLEFEFAPSKDMLNRWLAADPFQGYGGLFVMLDIEITRGAETVHAAKIVTYNVPFVPAASDQPPPPPKLPNRNPVISALRFDDRLTAQDDEVVTLEAGRSYELEPVFDRHTLAERYPVPTFPDPETGEPGYRVLEEKLQLEFYATAGDLGDATLESRTVLGEVEELKTTWEAPADPEDREVTLWVVIRDDRGGCSWTRRRIHLEPPK